MVTYSPTSEAAAYQLCDANATHSVLPAAWQAYTAAVAQLHTAPQSMPQLAAQLRAQIATQLQARAAQVIFTSGGTESDARALYGFLLPPLQQAVACHCVTSQVEHAAVRQSLLQLQRQHPALQIDAVAAARHGGVEVAAMQAALQASTQLVSLTYACNETGVLQPVVALARLCQARHIPMHSDAVQALGRVPLDFAALQAAGVTSLSLSGHKIGAVGGVGILLTAQPSLHAAAVGAPDASSTNVPGIAALAAALSVQLQNLPQAAIAQQRDVFEATLQALASPDSLEILGATQPRLGNTSCLHFPGCPGEALMMALDLQGIGISTGSACSSGSLKPSPILLGMGLTPAAAQQTVRFSFTHPLPDGVALAHTVWQVVQRIRAAGA